MPEAANHLQKISKKLATSVHETQAALNVVAAHTYRFIPLR